MLCEHRTSFSLLNTPIDIVSLARLVITEPDPYFNSTVCPVGTYVVLLDGSNRVPFEHETHWDPKTQVSLRQLRGVSHMRGLRRTTHELPVSGITLNCCGGVPMLIDTK